MITFFFIESSLCKVSEYIKDLWIQGDLPANLRNFYKIYKSEKIRRLRSYNVTASRFYSFALSFFAILISPLRGCVSEFTLLWGIKIFLGNDKNYMV